MMNPAPNTLATSLVIALAGVAAGAINALSGGGSLLSFPLLTALGIPALSANVSNTVGLLPGYVGAAFALRRQLAGQRRRAWLLLPTAALGGLAGGWLLLASGDTTGWRTWRPKIRRCRPHQPPNPDEADHA